MIIQAGAFTAFADDPVEEDAITIYIGMEDSHPVLLVEFSQDLLEKIMTDEGTWEGGRLVVSGDDIKLNDDGKYSFELRLSAKEGFVFDNALSVGYYGVESVYNLHYDFPLGPDGQHTMIVTGEFDNIISASPLINMGNIESADIAELIALVISGDYAGAVNYFLGDGGPFSKKARIDIKESSCESVSDDTYSYQLVLKTNEGFTFTNALNFNYKGELYGYKLDYKYVLATNGHTLIIKGIGKKIDPSGSDPAVTPAVTTTPAVIGDLPAVKISKPATAKKAVTVKWKKVSKKNLKKIQGIEIQAATDPEFTNIVKTATLSKKKTSKKIKGLKSKKTYYIRIRTYKNADDGRHVSAWRAKKVKIK